MSSDSNSTLHIELPEGRVALAPLFGPQDAHRRVIEKRLGIRMAGRGQQLQISGPSDRLPFAER
ncbi:MAG: hypothetical protein KC613_28180, partial [Myxococcales bacterium]|nr:hypothetical protein [Myxococcales bacterium]